MQIICENDQKKPKQLTIDLVLQICSSIWSLLLHSLIVGISGTVSTAVNRQDMSIACDTRAFLNMRANNIFMYFNNL